MIPLYHEASYTDLSDFLRWSSAMTRCDTEIRGQLRDACHILMLIRNRKIINNEALVGCCDVTLLMPDMAR